MLNGEQKIVDFIRDDIVAGQPVEFDRDTSLLESGLIDSMGLFRLITFLEETFNIRIPESDMVAENFQSVSKISEHVEKLLEKTGRS